MMARLIPFQSPIDRAIDSKRVGQVEVSQALLQGLLGIDAGDIVAVQQSDAERLAGVFRVFVTSDRLEPVEEGQPAPMIALAKVQ